MDLGPNEVEYTPLSDRLIAYYHQVLATHTDDPIIGACLICKVSRCEDWRSATERLIYTGSQTTAQLALPAALAEDGPR
jgi:hypothetical protein